MPCWKTLDEQDKTGTSDDQSVYALLSEMKAEMKEFKETMATGGGSAMSKDEKLFVCGQLAATDDNLRTALPEEIQSARKNYAAV